MLAGTFAAPESSKAFGVGREWRAAKHLEFVLSVIVGATLN
jgi:hypothetical protein